MERREGEGVRRRRGGWRGGGRGEEEEEKGWVERRGKG